MKFSDLNVVLNPGYLSMWWKWWIGELTWFYERIFIFSSKTPAKFTINEEDKLEYINLDGTVKINSNKANIAIPDSHIMAKVIRLPSSARKNFRQIIEYEFDKYFPLKFGDSYFSYRVVKNSDKNFVDIEVWAVRKNYIDGLIDKVKDSTGFNIKNVEIINQDNSVFIKVSVNTDKDTEHVINTKYRIPYFPYLVILLIVSCMITPLVKMESYIQDYELEIQSLEEKAKDLLTKKNKMSLIESGLNNVIISKNKAISITQLWSELTKIISGNGQVNNARFNENKVRLEGKAISVEKIVKLLEEDSRFTNVSIDAPVRRLENGKYESMNITFNLSNEYE